MSLAPLRRLGTHALSCPDLSRRTCPPTSPASRIGAAQPAARYARARRNAQLHLGTGIEFAPHGQLALDELGPFPHAAQAKVSFASIVGLETLRRCPCHYRGRGAEAASS